MTISKTVEGIIANSSFIRKMFEEGARLKAEHGPDNVFDFSLGNPNLPPPAQFKTIMHEIIDTEEPGTHGYMPQPGYPQVRNEVATFLTREYNVDISGEDVLMTCGAAGALNVIFKALLDPQDEVLSPQPCFVEYRFYVENHGGVFKTVPTKPDFSLDLEALAGAITEKTKVVLINSPNNPTGQVYSKESLDSLGALLEDKGKALDALSTWCRMNPTGKSFTTMLWFPVFLKATRRVLSPPPIQRIFPSRVKGSVLWPSTPGPHFGGNWPEPWPSPTGFSGL